MRLPNGAEWPPQMLLDIHETERFLSQRREYRELDGTDGTPLIGQSETPHFRVI